MGGKPKQRLQVNKWLSIIQHWLYPPTCLLCDAAGHNGRDLCPGCAAALPYAVHACPRCARPLPAAAPADTPCGSCQKKPPAFDSITALLRYEEPARYLLRALKFHQRHACARLLGELLAARLECLPALPELIVPVPLHPRRYAERGYNQSLELARPLSKHLGIPLDTQHCRRIRATLPQTELDAGQRRRNLRGAFRVQGNLRASHVAIVDDIVTTGSTVGELARQLKRAGIARVDVWCYARA